MSAIERRQVSRTKLEKLAYIHIEPDNGGIVLNVSDGGLAFHSMAPIKKNEAVHFLLKEQNRRIDVCGELIWTDEIQKIGGLRFSTLTKEAREQIATWTSRAEASDEVKGSTMGPALLRAFPNLKMRNLVPKIEAARDRLEPVNTRVRLKMSGFSGGLATGLLISMLAGFIFLFSYTHRQQFGESLIRMGERLAPRSTAPSAPAPVQQTSSAGSAPPVKAAAAPVPISPHAPAPPQNASERKTKAKDEETPFQDVVQIFPSPTKGTHARTDHPTEQRQPGVTSESSQSAAQRSNPTPNGQHIAPPNAGELAASVPASNTLPAFSGPTNSGANSGNVSTLREPLGRVQTQSIASAPASPLQRFFDLGKFKQQQLAQNLSDRVAQLGIRASVVNKGHLWMNSYQVLAGPYLTEGEENKIHNDLVSNGIKARPFERGSRGFAFRSPVTVSGSKLPVGDMNVTWETYVSEAKVKFMQDGAVLASADATWVQHPQKFAHNEYVYQNLGAGSRPLVEVHFAGFDRALVFR